MTAYVEAVHSSHAFSLNSSSSDGIAWLKGSRVLASLSFEELVCGASVAWGFIALSGTEGVVDDLFMMPEYSLDLPHVFRQTLVSAIFPPKGNS